MVHSPATRQDGHGRDAAILIHKPLQYKTIPLITDLQATAISIHLQRRYTICSLYLPHHVITLAQLLEALVRQLPPPFILLGDVNAKNSLWGSPSTDAHFDTLVMNHPITILSDGSPTHYHIQTGTFSTIDVALCSSFRADDFNYEVLSDNHTSDHYHVKISWKQSPTLLSPIPCFKPSQAKWTKYTELTIFENTNIHRTPIDDILRQIEQTIISAADNTIPKIGGHFSKPPVPWWSSACSAARRNRIRAKRTFYRNPTLENIIARNRTRAFAQYTLNTSRIQSFQSYVQSINQRCSLHSDWKKVSKIEGKFSPTPAPFLKDRNGVLHSSPQECANI